MATAASLSVKLGILGAVEFANNTKQARDAVKDLNTAVKNLENQFAGITGPIKQFGSAIAGLSFLALTQQTLEYADTVTDLAKGFDISVAKVLQFKDALLAAGGDGNKFEQILSKLYTAVDKAQQGDEVLINKFQKLGVTFKELSTLSPEQALNRVTKGLADNASGFEKVAIARELFGKSAAGLDFKELSEKLSESYDKQLKYAYSLEKIKDLHDAGKQSLINLQLAFSQFIPVIGDGAINVETFEKGLKALFAYFVATRVLSFAAAMFEVVVAIRAATTAAAAFNLVAGKGSPLGIILTGIGLAIGAATFFFDDITARLEKLNGSTPTAKPEDAGLAKYKDRVAKEEADRQKEAQERALTLKRVELDGAAAKYAATLKQIALERAHYQDLISQGVLSEQELKYKDIEYQSQKKLLELEKQRGDLAKQFQAKPDILAQETATIQAQINFEREKITLLKEEYVATERLKYIRDAIAINRQAAYVSTQNPFAGAGAQAKADIIQKGQEEIQNKVGAEPAGGYLAEQKAIIAAINERTDAEIRLQETQEARQRLQKVLLDSERETVDQAASDLQLLGQQSSAAFAAYKAIAIATATIDTYNAVQKAYIRGLEIPVVGWALGPVFAGIALAAGLARINTIRSQQPPGRAAGGPVTAGQPYTVGELGKETFVPDRNGTILNANRTADMEKGGPSLVVNGPYIANMSAIDTQSAQSFLAKNKAAVWAANQSASRSLPATR